MTDVWLFGSVSTLNQDSPSLEDFDNLWKEYLWHFEPAFKFCIAEDWLVAVIHIAEAIKRIFAVTSFDELLMLSQRK